MNTSALELKINSVQIICNLIHQTEKNFHAFIKPTAELMSELVNYQYSYVIRKDALKSIDGLIVACENDAEKKELLTAILPQITRLLDAKLDKLNFKELRMGMKQFQNILKNFWEMPEFLPVGTASAILDFLILVTQTVKKDKEERMKQLPKSRKKMDAEDLEDFFMDLEKVDKVAKFAMEVSAVLLKNIRDADF